MDDCIVVMYTDFHFLENPFCMVINSAIEITLYMNIYWIIQFIHYPNIHQTIRYNGILSVHSSMRLLIFPPFFPLILPSLVSAPWKALCTYIALFTEGSKGPLQKWGKSTLPPLLQHLDYSI